jgi:protoporphyrinogen oxidase
MGDLVIIGAGISGLSAGFHIEQKGMEYAIYEQNNHVGGLSATKTVDGFFFDYSGHLLHPKAPSLLSFINGLLGANLKRLYRKAWVMSHDVFIPFPFQANLRNLPPRVLKECLLGFVKAHCENEDLPTCSYATFHDWIVAKLGIGIGRHFMFPYNTKVWTVPPKKMTCQWLSEYVPRPSLEEVFDGAFSKQKKAFGYNSEFLYPRKGGIQVLADALASRTPRIQLNERLIRVNLDDKCAEFESGRVIPYRALISTIPLKTLVEKIEGRIPPAVIQAGKSLQHNSVLIVNLGVKGEGLTDKHWVYIPEKKYKAYRVGIYTNFSKHMAPPGMTSFYMEIAYQKKWPMNRKKVIDKAIEDMVEMKFVPKKKDIVIVYSMDIDCAYVINDKDYSRSRSLILDFLKMKNVHSIGRYGNWEYSGMEEALRHGIVVVDRLVK